MYENDAMILSQLEVAIISLEALLEQAKQPRPYRADNPFGSLTHMTIMIQNLQRAHSEIKGGVWHDICGNELENPAYSVIDDILDNS